jgi:rod shape-determining protein MreC
MLVINESGLIGYVVNTTSRYSTVQLLNTNKNFDSISVKIRLENDDNVYGLLSSYDSNKNLYKIEGINTNIDIPLNSTVVTSGLSINAPGGILVGYVESVSIDDLGLISTIYVRPSVNFKNISTVGVLIK